MFSMAGKEVGPAFHYGIALSWRQDPRIDISHLPGPAAKEEPDSRSL